MVVTGPNRSRAVRISAAAAAASSEGEEDGEEFRKVFYRTRLITFAAMFVGYGSYYLTRNSLSYVVPTLLNDQAIGLTMTQIGGLTSVLPVCYGAQPHPLAAIPVRHQAPHRPHEVGVHQMA